MTGANSFQVSGYGPARAGWTRLLARDSLARRLDWPILFSALALSMIGSVLVFSATRNRTEINQGDPYYFLIRHLMNTGIGFALMIGTVWVGHRTLRTVVPLLYGASLSPLPPRPSAPRPPRGASPPPRRPRPPPHRPLWSLGRVGREMG